MRHVVDVARGGWSMWWVEHVVGGALGGVVRGFISIVDHHRSCLRVCTSVCVSMCSCAVRVVCPCLSTSP